MIERAAAGTSRHFVGLVVLAGLACVIPDKDIFVEGIVSNPNPVRIVEPFEGVPQFLDSECSEILKPICDFEVCPRCPQIPPNGVPSFLNPDDLEFDFCACPVGEVDRNAFGEFVIYAEDADKAADDSPSDSLLAALLLDQPDGTHRLVYPGSYTTVGTDPGTLPYEQVIGRPRPLVRQFVIGDPETATVDLCNRTGLGAPLEPGFHTLRFLVTDRPWYADAEGRTQVGVPDLAAGATYDMRTYTFHCEDPESMQCQDQCEPAI